MPLINEALKYIDDQQKKYAVTETHVLENLMSEWLTSSRKTVADIRQRPNDCVFSVGRSFGPSLVIGLLLGENMSPADIFDPAYGRETKAKVAKEVMDKLYAVDQAGNWVGDYPWIAATLQKASRNLVDSVEQLGAAADLSDACAPETAMLLSLGNCCYDLYQEFYKFPKAITASPEYPTWFADDHEELLLKLNTLGLLTNTCRNMILAPENMLDMNYEPQFPLSRYVAGLLTRRYISEQKAENPGQSLYRIYSDHNAVESFTQYQTILELEQFCDEEGTCIFSSDLELRKAFAYAMASGLLEEHIVDNGPIEDADRKIRILYDDVDILQTPERAGDILIENELRNMGMTVDDAREYAAGAGLSFEEYLDEMRAENLRAQNEAAERKENSKNAAKEAPKAEFKTLGDVERYIESTNEKPVEEMVAAIRALNTISEKNASNAYACYQAGELVNTLGAEISSYLQKNPQAGPVFTKKDIEHTTGTMNRHRSAAKKMRSETTVTKEKSDEILRHAMGKTK